MREMICINCPLGCHLRVDDSDTNNITVEGNTCPRGKKYGIDEVLCPKRMVTTSVKINNGEYSVVSVKTKEAIPKELMFKVIDYLKNVVVEAPKKIGDIVVENVLNTGVDVIITKNVERIK